MVNKISKKELIEFYRVFGILLLSKLSVIDSLEIIFKQSKKNQLRRVIKVLIADLRAGKSISKSFQKHSKIFDEVFIANLYVAEETGKLAEVVSEYSSYQEKFFDLKQKIIQAARYPVFVISISFGVIFFMLYYLIPSFETLFFSVNANMPTITKILLAASNFIVMNISFLFMILIITLILIYFLLKTAFVKNKIIDQVLIKSPIISKFYLHNLLARFSLSMGILLKSKVPLEHSLRISRNISDNSIFINEINKIIYSLTKGETISKNLIKSEIFDLTFRKLIATGEESAELDKVFYLISEFYSKEFDNKINSITTLLEPLLILIVGLIVLIVLVAMYLPMFEIINYIGV